MPDTKLRREKTEKKKPIFQEASSEEIQQRSKRTNKNRLILSDLQLVENEEKIRFSDGRNLPIFFCICDHQITKMTKKEARDVKIEPKGKRTTQK